MANEDKATRYHRLRRRATLAAVLSAGLALGLAHLAGPPRFFTALPLAALALFLCAVAARLPAAFYRDVILTRRYGLLRGKPVSWLRDWTRHAAVHVVVGTLAVLVCAGLRWLAPQAWWGVAGALAAVTPLGIGHLLQRAAGEAGADVPLARGDLRERLTQLLTRAGYPDLGIRQTQVGDRTRVANAAVMTVGGQRRVVITDTLLADHTDDEVEVVVAHELAHVAHHDVVLTQVVEALHVAASLWVVDAALAALATPAGVLPAASLPVAQAVGGAAYLLLRPLSLAVSRLQERRADRYALGLTSNPEALTSVVRRMAASHLAEPAPNAWTVWWWHSHPGAEARIAAASRAR